MKILAIETSCDETAVAILEGNGDEKSATFTVLGDALLSQIELHQPYGGVYPTLAKREHQKNLPHILEEAVKRSGLAPQDIDVIAVTAGPGLEPALWVGIEFARALADKWGKPLIAANHMEGHILSALAKKEGETIRIENFELPLLALLISGGHTELVLMKDWLAYELVGQTLDDAVGEAFDKVARMLGLPYPGGPQVSKLAEQNRAEGNTPTIKLPRPMIASNTCNFSFAGLKTSVLYLLKDIPDLTEEKKKEVAHEFENAVSEVLWKKTQMALEQTGAKTLVIGGGVSANTHIRREFEDKIKEWPLVSLRIPSRELTTDNAIMIALAGFYRAFRGEFATDIQASGNLSLA